MWWYDIISVCLNSEYQIHMYSSAIQCQDKMPEKHCQERAARNDQLRSNNNLVTPLVMYTPETAAECSKPVRGCFDNALYGVH